MPKHGGRGSFQRSGSGKSGGKYGGELGKDNIQTPGFLGRSGAPTAEARSYASWNQKKGPDGSSTKISLPGGK